MEYWKQFANFKQRGEWVELKFMAEAAERGLIVSKPWGDTAAYDVGIEHSQSFLRVQVKSTACRRRSSYLCRFDRGGANRECYTLDQVDLFAAYIIPVATWYLIPAVVVLQTRGKTDVKLFPLNLRSKSRCKYECYREAWGLLRKNRRELVNLESCKG